MTRLEPTLNPPQPRADLFDEDGFLYDPEFWSESLCSDIADVDGVGPLSERHWRVISHVRNKFFQIGAVPSMRLVCRATAIPRQEVHELFGSCRTIWRLAGLPNPGEEVKTYAS